MPTVQDNTIYKDEGSTEEEDDNTESNKAKDKSADSVLTGSSDFFMSSPDNNPKGGIESAIRGGGAQYKACIGRDSLSLITHDCFAYSSNKCWDTIFSSPFQEYREQLGEGGAQLDPQDICEDPRSGPVEVR